MEQISFRRDDKINCSAWYSAIQQTFSQHQLGLRKQSVLTEVLRFCSVFYQIQSMQNSCEKSDPPPCQQNIYSTVALLLSEALWRKRRKFNLCSGRKFRPFHRCSWGLDPALHSCIWPKQAAGICQCRSTENTND